MAKGKFKHKPTGERTFSSWEEIAAGTSADRPRTFKKQGEKDVYDRRGEPELEEESEDFAKPQGEKDVYDRRGEPELEEESEDFAKPQGEKDVYDRRGEPELEEESEDFAKPKYKGTEGLIEIENPNLVKPKNIKAKDIDIGKTTDMSRREREELEKQQSHERYMKRQEQGKTEHARKDLERLTLIRQQRAEAAKKREEEKAAKEERKAEARK